MYIEGKLYFDEEIFVIKNCHIHIPGPKLKNGIAISAPGAPEIKVDVDMTSSTELFRWMNDTRLKSHVQIIFKDAHPGVPSYVFDLYDVQCVYNQEYFSSRTNGTFNTVVFVPGILAIKGRLIREMPWKVQSWESINSGSSPAPTEEEEVVEESQGDPQLNKLYFTDLEGEKLDELYPGEVYLVVESQDAIGETVTFDLSDPVYNYVFNGKELKDDILTGYEIKDDFDRLKLFVKTEE